MCYKEGEGMSRESGGSAKVVIIGAGFSGVAAASRLLSNGINDIIILEAQDYIGGRVHFVQSPDNLGVDLGAHWIHGQVGNIVYEMAEPLGLVQSSEDYEKPLTLVRNDGSVLPSTPAVLKFLDSLYDNEISEPPQHNETMAAHLMEQLYKSKDKLAVNDEDLKRLASFLSRSLCTLEGCGSLSDVSTKFVEEYQECDGDQLTMFKKEGYNNIISLLMRTHEVFEGKDPLPVREKTKLGERVASVDWSGAQAVVTTEKGNVYTADVVLITVSLAVLKAGNIQFTPALPKDKDDAIQSLGIDVVDKIYLFFDEAWWPNDTAGFGLLNDPAEGSHWGDYVSSFVSQKSNPTALTGWIVGDAARAMEEDTDENVIETCKNLLEKFVGPTQKVPPIKGMIRSRWASNKDVRGSYSYQSVAAGKLEKPRDALAKPMLNSLGSPIVRWAGEASHPNMFSTVHGAVASGFREADEIINSLKKVERVSVVIIGAGVAGLSAAKTITEAGCTSVALLEAQDVIGGRVKSRWVGDGYLELGAQWIHGTDQPLYHIASKAGLIAPYASIEGKGKYLRENGEEISEDIVDKINDVVESQLKVSENFAYHENCSQTVGQTIDEDAFAALKLSCKTEEEFRIMKDLLQWHSRWQEIDNSCNELGAMQLDTWGAFVMSDGEKNNNPSSGMCKIIEELISLANVPVTTNCPVTLIDSTGDVIKVVTQSEHVYEADHVLFTGSMAVLRNSPFLFNPSLPQTLKKGIEAKGMDLVVKVFLRYEKPWWEDQGYQFVWSTDSQHKDWTRYTTGVETVDGRDDTLLVWVGSYGASIVENLDEQQIGLQLTNVLCKFTNRSDIPLPSQVIKSDWGKNKFIQGAYSYMKTTRIDTGEFVHEVLATPVTRTLKNGKVISITLAGEAVHKELYSTLQGAYLSGQEQAQKVIQLIKMNDMKRKIQ